MKLIVTFADDEFFTFRDDTICLRVSNLNRLKDVINNGELRQDFIDGNRMLLEAAYDDTLIDEVIKLKICLILRILADLRVLRLL